MSSTTPRPAAPPPATPPPHRRLVRYPDDGMLGGVSVGLGAYFGIDPVLVRVGFVVLTLTGAVGIPLYAVLWLVVPRADAAVAPPSGTLTGANRRAGGSSPARFWVGLGLVALGAVALADAFDGPGNVLAALVLIGIGVALFTMDGDGPSTEPSEPAPAGRDDVQDAPPAEDVEDAVQPWSPPSTPVGAPAAGAPTVGASRRERSVLGRLTMAALLLWAGLALLVDQVTTLEVTAVTGIAVALLIVAGALMAGAWFGRARWLVLVGILLLPALAVAAVFDDFDLPLRGPTGEARLEVTDDLDYHHLAGEVTVDLRDTVVADGETVRADVSLTFGEVVVRLPRDVRVDLYLYATAGEFEVAGGQDVGGTRIANHVVYNADASGGTVEVDVRIGFGAVDLRGDAELSEQSTTTPEEVRA